MRWIHITGGLIGISSGVMALAALKGAWLHRRSGMVFVSSMLVMSAIGGLRALRQIVPGNVIPAVLTFYMVATALLTVKRPSQHARRIDIAAMLAAPTLSFFLGQPRVFSGGVLEPVALRVIPVVLVVAATIYWKMRVSSGPLAAAGDAE